MLGINHPGNIFAEVITIKALFASTKPSAIADCRGEFQWLDSLTLSKCYSLKVQIFILIFPRVGTSISIIKVYSSKVSDQRLFTKKVHQKSHSANLVH